LKLLRQQQIRFFQHNEKPKYTKEKCDDTLHSAQCLEEIENGPQNPRTAKKRLLPPKIKNFSNFRDLFKKTQGPRNLNSLRKVPSSTKQNLEK